MEHFSRNFATKTSSVVQSSQMIVGKCFSESYKRQSNMELESNNNFIMSNESNTWISAHSSSNCAIDLLKFSTIFTVSTISFSTVKQTRQQLRKNSCAFSTCILAVYSNLLKCKQSTSFNTTNTRYLKKRN